MSSSLSPQLARKQAVPPPPKGSVVVGAIRVPGINGPSEELTPGPEDADNPPLDTAKSIELKPDENDEEAALETTQPITVTATLAPSESQASSSFAKRNELNDQKGDDASVPSSAFGEEKGNKVPLEQSTSRAESKKYCNKLTIIIILSLSILAGVAIAFGLLLTKDDDDDDSNSSSSGTFIINDEVERRAQCPGIQRWRATPDSPCNADGQNCLCPRDFNGCDTYGDCPEIPWDQSPVNAAGEGHKDYAASSNRARCPGLQRYSASPGPDGSCPVEMGCDTANVCPEVAYGDVLKEFGS